MRPLPDGLRRAFICITLALLAAGCTSPWAASPAVALTAPKFPVTLPAGFGINVFAGGLHQSSGMAVDPDGNLVVAERGAGRIVRLPDRNRDGTADGVEVLGDGLNSPTSQAFTRDGSLLVAAASRILRLSQPDGHGFYLKHEILVDGLPQGGPNPPALLFSPDWSSLFVSISSPCTFCQEQNLRRVGILRYNPDGSGEQLLAAGISNPAGMAFRPGNGELWVTHNGPGLPGQNRLIEAVYHLTTEDQPDWLAVELPAHSAPLGLEFYTGDIFPLSYRGDLFVALHGSWDRRTPVGYKIIRIPLRDGQPGPQQDFATGWMDEASGRNWGRPVDLITGSDGSLYLSDDYLGIIYRIYYIGDD
jgi:glucose/arabinose dehydrogenase